MKKIIATNVSIDFSALSFSDYSKMVYYQQSPAQWLLQIGSSYALIVFGDYLNKQFFADSGAAKSFDSAASHYHEQAKILEKSIADLNITKTKLIENLRLTPDQSAELNKALQTMREAYNTRLQAAFQADRNTALAHYQESVTAYLKNVKNTTGNIFGHSLVEGCSSKLLGSNFGPTPTFQAPTSVPTYSPPSQSAQIATGATILPISQIPFNASINTLSNATRGLEFILKEVATYETQLSALVEHFSNQVHPSLAWTLATKAVADCVVLPVVLKVAHSMGVSPIKAAQILKVAHVIESAATPLIAAGLEYLSDKFSATPLTIQPIISDPEAAIKSVESQVNDTISACEQYNRQIGLQADTATNISAQHTQSARIAAATNSEVLPKSYRAALLPLPGYANATYTDAIRSQFPGSPIYDANSCVGTPTFIPGPPPLFSGATQPHTSLPLAPKVNTTIDRFSIDSCSAPYEEDFNLPISDSDTISCVLSKTQNPREFTINPIPDYTNNGPPGATQSGNQVVINAYAQSYNTNTTTLTFLDGSANANISLVTGQRLELQCAPGGQTPPFWDRRTHLTGQQTFLVGDHLEIVIQPNNTYIAKFNNSLVDSGRITGTSVSLTRTADGDIVTIGSHNLPRMQLGDTIKLEIKLNADTPSRIGFSDSNTVCQVNIFNQAVTTSPSNPLILGFQNIFQQLLPTVPFTTDTFISVSGDQSFNATQFLSRNGSCPTLTSQKAQANQTQPLTGNSKEALSWKGAVMQSALQLILLTLLIYLYPPAIILLTMQWGHRIAATPETGPVDVSARAGAHAWTTLMSMEGIPEPEDYIVVDVDDEGVIQETTFN